MSKQSQSIAAREIAQRRAVNDTFRRDRSRCAVMLSLGIIDLGRANQSVALAVVRSMTGYDDDPDDDHSIGDVEVICGDPDVGLATHLVFFKIVPVLQGDVPERVLLVMLASESASDRSVWVARTISRRARGLSARAICVGWERARPCEPPPPRSA